MDLSAGTDGKQIQLGYPTQTSCMDPGADPQSWDQNRGKPGTGGKYLWVTGNRSPAASRLAKEKNNDCSR